MVDVGIEEQGTDDAAEAEAGDQDAAARVKPDREVATELGEAVVHDDLVRVDVEVEARDRRAAQHCLVPAAKQVMPHGTGELDVLDRPKAERLRLDRGGYAGRGHVIPRREASTGLHRA